MLNVKTRKYTTYDKIIKINKDFKMSGNNSKQYEDTFYIIPRYIRKIPGLTLAFLDVYETMFQFWNKGRDCFLTNSTISERTGHEVRQIQYALSFLESKQCVN